jgi:carbonic anhydrase
MTGADQRLDSHMAAFVAGVAAAQAHERAGRPDFWRELARGQRPGVLVICCADSRSAPEHITRADPGALFVNRSVAGLVPTPPGRIEAAWLALYRRVTRRLGLRDLASAWYGPWAAIEFPVVQLEVPNIVVLGHSGCGGVRLAMEPRGSEPRLGDTDAWVDMVRPAVQAASAGLSGDDAVRAAERAAVLWSTRNLLMHRVVAARVAEGITRVYAARYDIAGGGVEFWDPATRVFRDAAGDVTAISTRACATGCACRSRPADRRGIAAVPAM